MYLPNIFVDARYIRRGMSGVGIYVYNILKSLAEILPTQKITALFLKDEVPQDFKVIPNIDWIETDVDYENHIKNEIWENTTLVKIAKQKKTDIFFGPAFLIPWVKTPFKKVVTIHDFIADKFPQNYTFLFRHYIRIITRLSSKFADAIIAVSENTKKACTEIVKVHPNKIKVIYEAPSPIFKPLTQEEKLGFPINLPTPFILFVGNLEPRKNLITLVKGFEIAIEKYNIPHHLVIIGKIHKNSREIIAYLRKSKILSQRIHIIPYVEMEKIVFYYNSAEMFIFPSKYEGFGLPPLEAMACGLPVISSNIDVEKEILGDSAAFFDVGDAEQLAALMVKIYRDEEFRNNLKERGLNHSKSFSWETSASKIFKLFIGLMESNSY